MVNKKSEGNNHTIKKRPKTKIHRSSKLGIQNTSYYIQTTKKGTDSNCLPSLSLQLFSSLIPHISFGMIPELLYVDLRDVPTST